MSLEEIKKADDPTIETGPITNRERAETDPEMEAFFKASNESMTEKIFKLQIGQYKDQIRDAQLVSALAETRSSLGLEVDKAEVEKSNQEIASLQDKLNQTEGFLAAELAKKGSK